MLLMLVLAASLAPSAPSPAAGAPPPGGAGAAPPPPPRPNLLARSFHPWNGSGRTTATAAVLEQDRVGRELVAGVQILLVDACRRLPLPRSTTGSGQGRPDQRRDRSSAASGDRGLTGRQRTGTGARRGRSDRRHGRIRLGRLDRLGRVDRIDVSTVVDGDRINVSTVVGSVVSTGSRVSTGSTAPVLSWVPTFRLNVRALGLIVVSFAWSKLSCGSPVSSATPRVWTVLESSCEARRGRSSPTGTVGLPASRSRM